MSNEVYDHDPRVESLSAAASPGRLRNPPVRMVVTQQIEELEKEIKARKDLLEALDANPGVEGVLDKMRKLHI